MSSPVHERLRQLETEVRHLQVLPAGDVRARGRRRGRRQMTAAVVGVAVVASTAGLTATGIADRPDQGAPAIGAASAGPAVACVLDLPSDPSEVRVRVLDGGAPGGRTATTANGLRERGFTVLPGTGGATNGPTTLHYGPAAIGAAALMRAELIGGAVMAFDPGRSDDTIDLTLGSTFDRLATTTELNQALVAVGEPSAPPEC